MALNTKRSRATTTTTVSTIIVLISVTIALGFIDGSKLLLSLDLDRRLEIVTSNLGLPSFPTISSSGKRSKLQRASDDIFDFLTTNPLPSLKSSKTPILLHKAGPLSPGDSLPSNHYITRCTSAMSICDPQYFLLTSKGELIHGRGYAPSDGKFTTVLSRSKPQKREGDYLLQYSESGRHVSLILIKKWGVFKGIEEVITTMVDVEDKQPKRLWGRVAKFLGRFNRNKSGGEEAKLWDFRGVWSKAKKFFVNNFDRPSSLNRREGEEEDSSIILEKTKKHKLVFKKKTKQMEHLMPWPIKRNRRRLTPCFDIVVK
jgi:hypothetical protein